MTTETFESKVARFRALSSEAGHIEGSFLVRSGYPYEEGADVRSRKRFKAVEREVAADFDKGRGDTQRVPITGRTRGDVPDVDHPTYSIEVKAGRNALSAAKIREAQDQARASAAKDGKLPISVHVLSTQGRPAFKVVVVPYDVFVSEFV